MRLELLGDIGQNQNQTGIVFAIIQDRHRLDPEIWYWRRRSGEPLADYLSRQGFAVRQAGDAAKAEELLVVAQKRIDMAVTKGVLHKNTAARRKARLTAQVRSILA